MMEEKRNSVIEKNLYRMFDRESEEIHLVNPRRNLDRKTVGIDRLFLLYKHNICIKLNPTHRYMTETIDCEQFNWYTHNEIIKGQAEEIMNFKIHTESKFSKMSITNETFDKRAWENQMANVCQKGCSLCCHDLFYVSENEFLYMVAWLIKNKGFIALYDIYQNAVRQDSFMKENYPGISKMIAAEYEASEPEFFNLGYTLPMLEPCPFLSKEGRCSCYSARPGICRLYGTTSKCSIAKNNPEHFQNYDLQKMLSSNMVLQMNDKYHVRQARPIYYYFVHCLSREQVVETLHVTKKFVSLPESEFLLWRGKEKYIEL